MEPQPEKDPKEGLVPGRIVYFIFDQPSADEVNRRRTTGSSIADRIKRQVSLIGGGGSPEWPVGAQAHIGNAVYAGDLYPAMVIRVQPGTATVNLKVFLDGSDEYWATSVEYNKARTGRTWSWMFEGQATRYTPDRVANTAGA